RADGGKRLHNLGQYRTNEATMPRRNKSARLWLRPEATKKGKLHRRATWIIIDGGRHFSTGCLSHEIEKAERKLAEHVARKYQPSRKERDIELIDVADAGLNEDLFGEHVVSSYVDSPHFVQRSSIIEQVEKLLAENNCRFVLLSGPPGVGKS